MKASVKMPSLPVNKWRSLHKNGFVMGQEIELNPYGRISYARGIRVIRTERRYRGFEREACTVASGAVSFIVASLLLHVRWLGQRGLHRDVPLNENASLRRNNSRGYLWPERVVRRTRRWRGTLCFKFGRNAQLHVRCSHDRSEPAQMMKGRVERRI